jgi:hypothetical protein
MRHYLVVANQTLGGEHLAGEIRTRMADGPARFHLLVPASPPTHATWTEGEANANAEERLQAALERFRDVGADVIGGVGDPDPMQAITDVLRERTFDEIILSTLPAGASRWLRADLLHRIQRHTEIPVTHVVGEPEPAERAT